MESQVLSQILKYKNVRLNHLNQAEFALEIICLVSFVFGWFGMTERCLGVQLFLISVQRLFGNTLQSQEWTVIIKYGLLLLTKGTGLESMGAILFLYYLTALFKAEKYDDSAYWSLLLCGFGHCVKYFDQNFGQDVTRMIHSQRASYSDYIFILCIITAFFYAIVANIDRIIYKRTIKEKNSFMLRNLLQLESVLFWHRKQQENGYIVYAELSDEKEGKSQ